jgi:hypothetical protein
MDVAPVIASGENEVAADPKVVWEVMTAIDAGRIGIGMRSRLSWKEGNLQPRDYKTIVRREESWERLLLRIFRGPMRKMLQRSIDIGLLHLLARAREESESLNNLMLQSEISWIR